MPRTTLLVPAAALILALAGCSTDTSQDGAPPARTEASGATGTTASAAVDQQHNDADTAFAQMMIVHHEGAVEMADLAVRQASAEEVRALAEDISAAQGPEIELMETWLQAWGEDTAAGGGHGTDHGDMDMSGMEMDGLTQEQAMSELSALDGPPFDQRFLELMIAHHEGALQMSREQLEEGENPQALELAQEIVEAQQSEIALMEGMLSSS